MKILIAEDEKNIARGIAVILQSQQNYKCQIRLAENGREALEIAESFRPDLVITDIRMFHLNGLQLAEQLKERNICDKVIIISGYSRFEYAQKALRINVMDYLLKPIDKQQLLQLVDKVWKRLPSNYASIATLQKPNHSFFNLDLDNTDYPGSLKKVISYIKENYMHDLSLQIISEELMLHPNYISSLINKYTHVNFSYLLDYVRLEKACELLISSPDMKISKISYLVGYNDERRLYNAFHKRLSCTPGDFRSNSIIK